MHSSRMILVNKPIEYQIQILVARIDQGFNINLVDIFKPEGESFAAWAPNDNVFRCDVVLIVELGGTFVSNTIQFVNHIMLEVFSCFEDYLPNWIQECHSF